MAKNTDTKFIKVIISERFENKEYAEKPAGFYIKQGGVIVENGKNVAKSYTIELNKEVEIPENFAKYISERKALKPNPNMDVEYVKLYNVEKV